MFISRKTFHMVRIHQLKSSFQAKESNLFHPWISRIVALPQTITIFLETQSFQYLLLNFYDFIEVRIDFHYEFGFQMAYVTYFHLYLS